VARLVSNVSRLAAGAVVLLGLSWCYPLVLRGMGGFLVNSDDPAKADIVVVLAGDSNGNRVLKAAELVRQGFAPRALVSGPYMHYQNHESELAIPFAVKHGYPAEYFVPFPNYVTSTRAESRVIVRYLRYMGIRRYLLVTSDYHTRRAGKLFRKAGPDLEVRVIAAPDADFRADGWWKTRQGRKQFFFEWAKTVGEVLEL